MVAVKAENLEMWRISSIANMAKKICATTGKLAFPNCEAMRFSIIINVVEGKEKLIRFTTAHTVISIMAHYVKAQLSAVTCGGSERLGFVFDTFGTPPQRCFSSTQSSFISFTPLTLILSMRGRALDTPKMLTAFIAKFLFRFRWLLATSGAKPPSSKVAVTLFFVLGICHVAISHV